MQANRPTRRDPGADHLKPPADSGLVGQLRALDSPRRLQILRWLKDPTRHFPPQVDGDLEEDGVCGLLIARKLGVSQPTVSDHMRLLVQSGLVRGKRIKQWTFYRRDERRISEFTAALVKEL